ncbi:hypothetical protein [Clostridium sp. BJN0013]|uniref:hypothetical protein n=1 Tax=Clostridium sp. BJN0013 TaxID=3236840 RepID=UPI0034C6297A
MTELKKCSKCNANLVECHIEFNTFSMLVAKTPRKHLFNLKPTELFPFVCPNCGFTEWYAKDLTKLNE